MRVDIELTHAEEYFAKEGLSVDYDETGAGIPLAQAKLIDEILALECSIYTLRRVTGLCGHVPDVLVSLRRNLVERYEIIYTDYIEYRDFY